MSKTNYKDDIISFYNQYLAVCDLNNSEAVAWDTKESQLKRFEVLLEIGVNKESDRLLDLGCGLGHLVDYMSNRGYDIENYVGLDINPHYIFFAATRNKGVDFRVGEIFDVSETFDYIIGSGNFTVKMEFDEILNAIAKAYELSKKGVAFNFLTDDFSLDDNGIFNKFNPDEFMGVINKIYPKTRLITNYLGNEDFTIYIYK